MLEKKVVIHAIPALQGQLYNRLKYIPFAEPIIARNLIAKDFQEHAALDALEAFKKDARLELGGYFSRMGAKRKESKDPTKALEEWKTRFLEDEKKWEGKLAGEGTPKTMDTRKGDAPDPARIEKMVRSFFKGTEEELQAKISEYISSAGYFAGLKTVRTELSPSEMLGKVRKLILRADELLMGDGYAGKWDEKLGIALARLHSEGNLHVYISILDGNGTRYGNAFVSTNLTSTHNISNKRVAELLAEPIETAGHGASFKFTTPKENGIPVFQLQTHSAIAIASLEGIANLVEEISSK